MALKCGYDSTIELFIREMKVVCCFNFYEKKSREREREREDNVFIHVVIELKRKKSKL